MLKRLALGSTALLLLLILGGLFAVWQAGAWHVLFPSTKHESVPPVLPADLASPAVLLFTKTNQFRHEQAIAAGTLLFERLAAERGWSLFHTENGAVFEAEPLSRFDAVIFHNVTGDVLATSQQSAFRAWLEAGGGWLGIHSAGDGSHEAWPWYVENLLGVEFIAHTMGPQFQTAALIAEAPSHPAMAGLPARWEHEEEWYSWHAGPPESAFEVLMRVDESSYSPGVDVLWLDVDLRMGRHPVAWSRCVGRGRAVYSALGHQGAAYELPWHERFLANALEWILTLSPCRGAAAPAAGTAQVAAP